MKRFFPAVLSSAILGSIVTIVVLYLLVPDFSTGSNSAKISQDLSGDAAFVASLQNKLEQNMASSFGGTLIKGDKGDTGNQGGVGSSGASGQNGGDGIDGNIGASGIDGLQGNRGSQGLIGSDGTAGEQGVRGVQGPVGPQGLTGPTGAQGTPGATGLTGPQGIQGATGTSGPQGIQGDTGATGPQGIQGAQGIQGQSGVVSVSATGLTYNSGTQDIDLTTGYAIPTTTSVGNWTTAYGWGNHSLVGYALLAGQSGGQTLIGGTAANELLTLRSNSASSSNTSTNTAIVMQVGNSGSVSALSIRHDGNVGIGTATPGSKLTVYGDIAVTTNGTNNIKPFQFVQITGLGDFPNITSFGGSTYPVGDWNAAVVGMQNGDSCGVPWTNGPISGFRYWWDTTGGNWRLIIDQGSVNDGCNNVQVLFVRREISSRSNYGF